jgi:predicted HTH domain antitoxin
MSITLHIPDSVTSGLRLPEEEIEARLRTELVIALYEQGILSFGKGCELAAILFT